MKAQIWRSVFGVSAGVLIVGTAISFAGEGDEAYDYFAEEGAGTVAQVSDEEAAPTAPTAPAEDAYYATEEENPYRLTTAKTMQEPVEPQQPLQPEFQTSTQVAQASPFGAFDLDLSQVQSENRTAPPPSEALPSDAVIGGEQVLVRASDNVGTLLQDSPASTNVSLFRRPVASDIAIRGYHSRQIYTQMNGGQWLAARPDFDTVVSKIDSGIIQDVIVIKGPFSALYGPALAFVDVVTAPTMRSDGDYLVGSSRTVFNINENGGDYYGRQVFEVGAYNWGARASMGLRGSGDYEAGDGTIIESSYKMRDYDFAFGYDTSPDDHWDFHFVRQEIPYAQFDNQLLNIDDLQSNGATLRLTMDCVGFADQLVAEGWYNDTQAEQQSGTVFIPGLPGIDTLNAAAAFVDQNVAGGRASVLWGDRFSSHLIAGADVRYSDLSMLELRREQLLVLGVPVSDFTDFSGVPDSESINPGVFFQGRMENDSPVGVNYGGRFDYVDQTTAAVDPNAIAIINAPPGTQFTNQVPRGDREFELFSLFATGDLLLTDELTLTAGVGHGQRAPNLFELYNLRTFVAGNQLGVQSIAGNPFLQEEKATQLDVGLLGNYCDARFELRGFAAYVEDYVSVSTLFADPFSATAFNGGGLTQAVPARQYLNVDARLFGAEFNGEVDLNDNWSVFGLCSYTHGSDLDRDIPLFGIYPFQSRTGVRYETGDLCQGYGFEYSVRIVDGQSRIANDGTPFADAAGLGGTNPFELPTQGFTTHDVRGFYRVNENWLLTAGVLNIFDVLYYEHFDYHTGISAATPGGSRPSFQPGVSAYFGTELTF